MTMLLCITVLFFVAHCTKLYQYIGKNVSAKIFYKTIQFALRKQPSELHRSYQYNTVIVSLMICFSHHNTPRAAQLQQIRGVLSIKSSILSGRFVRGHDWSLAQR